MKFYQDITLIPGAEVGFNFLWSKLYQQVHLALVEMKDEHGNFSIGVGLPEYSEKNHRLGRKLRLLAANEEAMTQLNIQQWLARLSDYIHCTSIKNVPENIESYARFSRVQKSGSVEKLARRAAKRQNIPYEQALEQRKQYTQQLTRLPFVKLKSLSGDHEFALSIKKEAFETPQQGSFGSYGLTQTGSIPNF